MGKHLVEALGVEANHHLVAYHHGGGGAALILVYQFFDRGRIRADIAVFVLDTSLREVGLDDVARRSTRLGENYDLLLHHLLRLQLPGKGCTAI